MPHQCTNCERTFDDGSKEMLSGCPDCGGNKFQFKPDGVDSVDTSAEPPEPPEPANTSSVAKTVGKTAATVKDLMSSDDSGEMPGAGTESSPTSTTDAGVRTSEPLDADREDTAQASARSDIVRPDELPSEPAGDEHHFRPVATDETASESSPTADATASSAAPDRTVATQQSSTGSQSGTLDTDAQSSAEEADAEDERPGLEELRDELNDQFESIKVVEPGQYELNLMELYDREEYIVALEEDGRYSIQVPENFRD